MIIKEQVPNMIDKEPENITLSDAQKTFNAIYSQYSQDLGTSATMTSAIQSGLETIKEIPAGLQQTLGQELYSLGEAVDTVLPVKKVLIKILPANNKIYNANNDLTLGDRLKKVGEWQIETANRNLENLRREYMNNVVDISEDELNSWTYKITSGGLQYGTMLGLGMINPQLAMSYMGALTLGSESIEGADKYKERTGSIEGFAKESSKELALNVGNTAVQLFTEKLFGIPAQLKRFRSAKDFFKAGFRGALDEFGTENLQNLEDAIFDYMGNRFDEDETILTRMQDNFRDTLVAAMFGGGAGMSFAIYNRSKGIQDIKENLISPDVPEYQREELATKVYDKNIETLQNALTSELELSSELRAKYGERYDKLKQEIHNQIKDVGAYSNYTEDQIAQYVEATSKNFADQILAESVKRKVLMDDIVKSSQIVYDNGRLYLQGIDKGKKQKDFFQIADENEKLDSIYPEYKGETININGVDKTVYNSNGERIAKSAEALQNFYKWFGKSKVVDEQGKPLVVYHGTHTVFDTFDLSKVKSNSGENILGAGFYFTDNLKRAERYAYGFTGKGRGAGQNNIMEVYLNIQNPAHSAKEFNPDIHDGIIEKLEGKLADLGVTYFVTDSNQIKSTQNRGTFSTESDNIYYQREISDEELEADLAEFDKILDSFAEENKEYYNKKGKFDAAKKLQKKYQKFFMYNIADASNHYGQHDPFYFEYDGEKDITNIWIPKKLEKSSNIILYRGAEQIFVPVNEFDESKFKKLGYKRQKKFYEGMRDIYTFNKDEKSDMIFHQITNLPKQEKKIKGSFDALTKSIKITDKADFSTYQHEFAHFWLDNIWDYMHSGLASPEYTKQWREVMRWLGVKDDEQYPKRPHHEKFARAYEKYLVNGEVPNSIMGEAFNKYENFIKEVYDSMRDVDEMAGKKYEPLSVAMYDFFDSMVTGKLPMPEGMAEKMTVEQTREVVNKNIAEAKEFVAEEKKILEENRENYNLKPAETSTKKSYLTSLKKTTGELVEAGTTTNAEQIKRATEFVNNNIDKAERIINGEELPPDGILTNAVFMAYNEYQKRLGNDDKRANALINQANQLRRMGQEIQSQSMVYKGIEKFASAEYWIRSVTANRIQKIADANKMTVSETQEKINSLIKSGYNDNMKPDDIVKKIGEELGITEFYQTDYTELNSYKAVEKYVEERIGTSLTIEQARNIITRADNIGKDIENSSSVTGNPSVDFFVKLKELEDYANSLSPSSNLRVLVSVVGRGNLLSSLKSPLTNIVSNTSHSIYRHILRRIRLMQNTDFISNDKKKAVYDYSWEIFKKTGYNVNNMQEDINTYLGESITHSQGEGKIRALGRFYENLIFKWSLGAGDVYFKDRAFVDYLALKASKEGKTAEKANKLFDDAILIEPKTDDGKRLRQEAIEESLITTFQNKGIISEKALKARSSFDFGAGFGEAIAPFVKTPANVVGVGLEAGFGGIKAIANEIIRDIKAGKIQKPTQENIKLMVNNGLGLILAFLLTANFDDEDYMPAYAMATSKDKQLAKQLNIPFNAIRFGNTWFSLDYLGPLASPIVGILQAKREEGFLNKIFGYSKSAGIQSLTLPAFGNISDIFENIKNSLRKTADDIIPDTIDSLIGQVYSRLTPAIISDIAKALDDYDREAKDHRIMAKIPFVREKLEKKINLTTGKAEKIDNAIIDILAGSRVKVQVRNKVADEFSRLNNAGYGVSLTDVTQRGLLSKVSEPYKKEIREKFAREYAKEVNKLIVSPKYRRMSDEDKKESIDKVKRKIVEDLKKQYLKKVK